MWTYVLFYSFKAEIVLQQVGFILCCTLVLKCISHNTFEPPTFSFIYFQKSTYSFALSGKSCQRNTIWRRKEGYGYQNIWYI